MFSIYLIECHVIFKFIYLFYFACALQHVMSGQFFQIPIFIMTSIVLDTQQLSVMGKFLMRSLSTCRYHQYIHASCIIFFFSTEVNLVKQLIFCCKKMFTWMCGLILSFALERCFGKTNSLKKRTGKVWYSLPLRSMYIFGGFSGVILNDVLVYKPSNCEAFLEVDLCQSSGPGVRCVWKEQRCVPWDSRHANDTLPASFCPARTSKYLSL